MTKRFLLVAVCATFVAAAALVFASPPVARADDPMKVVASFSVIGDLVKNIGGERVAVSVLVGPNSDAHVYSPSPADAKAVGAARMMFVNGLGLEGWLPRLAASAGGKAQVVTVTNGVVALKMEDEHKPGHMIADPHAWQSVANVKRYVVNIRDGLSGADPAGKATYDANAAAYLDKLSALEGDVIAAVKRIPADRRRIITTHDAFGYFSKAYGVEFISPEGVSTEAEASAKDVAKIIRQIREQKIPAVFLENISDPRLIEQIARETGARIGGTLYSDALSPPDGPAATYLTMMRHNVGQLAVALTN